MKKIKVNIENKLLKINHLNLFISKFCKEYEKINIFKKIFNGDMIKKKQEEKACNNKKNNNLFQIK